MVTFFVGLWATALAQAIVPGLVFWPLFIISQIMMWGTATYYLLRVLFHFLSFVPGGVLSFFGAVCDDFLSFFPNKEWDEYKKHHIR